MSGAKEEKAGKRALLDSYTERSEILMPNDTNDLGRALGGAILHWMDVCGAIAARRYARQQVVTASMEGVDFLAAVDLGDIVTVIAYVFDTGQTSIEVKIDVYAERPCADRHRRAATSLFTFVALDAEGAPTPVPALVCPTDSQQALRRRACDERLERRERYATLATG